MKTQKQQALEIVTRSIEFFEICANELKEKVRKAKEQDKHQLIVSYLHTQSAKETLIDLKTKIEKEVK